MPRKPDGRQEHSAYPIWLAMRQRVRDDSRYAGRVFICPEWDDFWTFARDMGERPKGLTLDRIDGEGNYEPSNCRWATYSTQNFNRRKFTCKIPDECKHGHVYIPIKDSEGNRRCSECLKNHNRERSLADFERRKRKTP